MHPISNRRSLSLIFAVMIVLLGSGNRQLLGQGKTENTDQNRSGVVFSDWILMQPSGAEAEFLMPTKPRYRERSFIPVQNRPPIKVRQHQATSEDRTTSFVFGYHDHFETPTGKRVANTLDGAVGGSVVRVSGKLLAAPKKIVYGKYPGREFSYVFAYEGKIHQAAGRVFLVGKRQYFLQALFEKDKFDDEIAERFLNSFRIVKPDLPPRPPFPPKKSTDQ